MRGAVVVVWLGCGASSVAPTPPAPVAPTAAPTTLVYAGDISDEGHFRVPGELRPFHARFVVNTGAAGDARLDATTWEGSDAIEADDTETTWLLPGSGAIRGSAWLDGDDERDARAEVAFLTGRAIGSDWTFVPAAGYPSLARPTALAHRFAHDRLGDVDDLATYLHGGVDAVATQIRWSFHARDESFIADLHAVAPTDTDRAPAAPPSRPGGTPPDDNAPPVIAEVAPGVWEVRFDALDARSFVIERANDLVVIEAPLGSRVGERIVDALAAQFPHKPIGLVMFGHYHPHYTGGLRAFLAAGATIIAPWHGTRLAHDLAMRPFTRAPDRLARLPADVHAAAAARMTSFTDRAEVDTGGVRIDAIDIGDSSRHTAEYVVFYLPAQRLLIEGDLGWFTLKAGGTKRMGQRAVGLLGAIETRGLAVDTLLQTWPVRAPQHVAMAFADWKALVEAPPATR